MGLTRSRLASPREGVEIVAAATPSETSQAFDAATLVCDAAGVVVDESLECRILMRGSMMGRSLGELMTPALAELHQRALFPKYAASRGVERAHLDVLLRLHGRSGLSLFDAKGQPLGDAVAVDVQASRGHFHVSLLRPVERPREDGTALSLCDAAAGPRRLRAVGVLAIGFASDAVEFEQRERVRALALRLLADAYRPLVWHVQTVADIIIFAAHGGAVGPRLQCSLLARFLVDVCEASEDPLCAAASYGEATVSLEEGRFQLSGSPCARAVRLLAFAASGSTVVCEAFYQQLRADATLAELPAARVWTQLDAAQRRCGGTDCRTLRVLGHRGGGAVLSADD